MACLFDNVYNGLSSAMNNKPKNQIQKEKYLKFKHTQDKH